MLDDSAAFGDALAHAVAKSITFAHNDIYADRAADGNPEPYAEPCPVCSYRISDQHAEPTHNWWVYRPAGSGSTD